MAIPEKLAIEMNKQVTAELEAALVYLQLSYILDDMGLSGMRDWMRAQSDEEMTHAAAFSQHLLDRGYMPKIREIEAIDLDIDSALGCFEASLAHEKKVSGMIRDLTALSNDERDFDSRPLLDRFLDEQIEEEASVGEIVNRLKIAGDNGSAILLLDQELGSRDSAE
ncbi:ferritin [Corynebacterium mendelii]|uniref:Ferritin n=1 Tax=Corynebacterium mendelii TaxID=2765362 RepID=A0A939IVD4_9CORY|nr:ferritin [Corynebacterium mendelii]MBN9644121.1 ferritin [Corynebacterium mendelii]